jgi:hypothetical protein
MPNDAEHFDVRVDHKQEETDLDPNGCMLRNTYCT